MLVLQRRKKTLFNSCTFKGRKIISSIIELLVQNEAIMGHEDNLDFQTNKKKEKQNMY